MKKLIAANWKNNGSKEFVKDYFDYFLKYLDTKNEIIFFPPDLYIDKVNNYRNKKNFNLGGQTLNTAINNKKLTSGTSSKMYIDNGCSYILIGHSEVREITTGKYIKNSLQKSDGLQVIFCVGENQEFKNNASIKIYEQLTDLYSNDNLLHYSETKKIIVAYEPIWAIGTGETPKLDDIAYIHESIKTNISENLPFFKEKDIIVIYGGSVDLKNAKDILATPNVDGILIGGASLNVKEFTTICNLKI